MSHISQDCDRDYNWHELKSAADVWLLYTDDISPENLEVAYDSWLSAEERAHSAKFRTERSRHDFLATRALCRGTLSRYANVDPADWCFRADRNGKPEVTGPAQFTSLRFNLAHTSGLVACAVSRAGDVGVDVEETTRAVDVARLARHFVSRREQAIIEGLPENLRRDRLYGQWVAKEAYLKGSGTGIAQAPERFTIEFDENGLPLPVGPWHLFVTRPSATHLAALAVCRRPESPRIRVEWLKADDLIHRAGGGTTAKLTSGRCDPAEL